MSMIHCKECGAEVSKSAKVCPKCGKKLKHNGLRIVIGIILIFIGLGVIFSFILDFLLLVKAYKAAESYSLDAQIERSEKAIESFKS